MWTAESSVKRRGSPSSLASKEPNPKRRDACADSPLITQLINDKFIESLACVLAVDEKIVGMAKKLLEGAKFEHGTHDLDAWKYFTSLPFWRNDEFMQYPTKMGPKQEHLNQQIQETKACISNDRSLKPLFAMKEHIRVVLILVILFWSRDVSPAWDESLYFKDIEWGSCCAFDPFHVDDLRMFLPKKKEKKIENLADELMNDHEIVLLFRDLMGTVHNVSSQGALEHLDKVKEVWENHRFIDHLVKCEYDLRHGAERNSNSRLSVSIKSLIKKDILFEMISKYDDPDFRMRVALSILIGFWSNQDMIRPLVDTMGGGVKKELSGEGKVESPRDWMSNTPKIMEFYSDKSIWKLADQLKEEPRAVKLANSYLKKLEALSDCFCSYETHFKAASSFWYEPRIIKKLNEAMKKDSKLVEVFTKYSKGAENLRGQERLIHIWNDYKLELKEIDSNSNMRLALQILFDYWVDRDMTHLFLSSRKAKKKTGKVFDRV